MQRQVIWAMGALAMLALGCTSAVDGTSAEKRTGDVTRETFDLAAIPESAEMPSSAQPVKAKRIRYLRDFYKHFAAERAAATAAMLPAELIWSHTGYRSNVVPFAGDYEGARAHLQYFRDYFDAIRLSEYQFQYKLANEDHVSWHFKIVAFVPATGKTFEAEFVHVWTFDGDRPTAVRSYFDTQIAIQAFTPGGRTWLTDLEDPTDDHRVGTTSYDVESLVRTVYDRFYAGDIPAVLAMLSDDAAIYFKGRDFPFAGTYIGKPSLLQFVYNLAGTALPYDIQRFQITEGDRTDVVLYENWQVFATNKAFHCHTVNSWRLNDAGLLMGFDNVPDTDAVAQAYIAN
ncbi:MAG TPA: nuclear transport factor 2 family protein [Polyangiaceae bacterium]|nr:nuclear transport factor 2 family protein [Polyangiaceae bacterium]